MLSHVLVPFLAAQTVQALPGPGLVSLAGLCLTFGSASHKSEKKNKGNNPLQDWEGSLRLFYTPWRSAVVSQRAVTAK